MAIDIEALMDKAEDKILANLPKNCCLDDVAWGDGCFRIPVYRIKNNKLSELPWMAFRFSVSKYEDEEENLERLDWELDHFIDDLKLNH